MSSEVWLRTKSERSSTEKKTTTGGYLMGFYGVFIRSFCGGGGWEDNFISRSELRKLLQEINIAKASIDVEEATNKFIEELDVNRDHVISEEEFISGPEKWLSLSSPSPVLLSESRVRRRSTSDVGRDRQVVEENQSKAVVDKTLWAWLKAIINVVVGIAMLSVLAEPLIESVRRFSNSAGVNAFFISFVLVPLATKAKKAIFAVASHKKSRTTSLSISEIYGGVFMNNVLGFFAISVLIYARGITWEFSAEALVVALVCIVVGLATSFNSTFLHGLPSLHISCNHSLVLLFLLKHVVSYTWAQFGVHLSFITHVDDDHTIEFLHL